MKRSEINRAFGEARESFARHHWALPPKARWDITDFGRGDFARFGLTLVTLTAEPEYGERLMFARRGQMTPCHSHYRKKEDLICRVGELSLRLWPTKPEADTAEAPVALAIAVDGESCRVTAGQMMVLGAGSRVTIPAGVWHEFYPTSDECILSEVSTAGDDGQDVVFLDATVGRRPWIEEDAAAEVKLVSE
jgi:D-lyxose ketol-isomerase